MVEGRGLHELAPEGCPLRGATKRGSCAVVKQRRFSARSGVSSQVLLGREKPCRKGFYKNGIMFRSHSVCKAMRDAYLRVFARASVSLRSLALSFCVYVLWVCCLPGEPRNWLLDSRPRAGVDVRHLASFSSASGAPWKVHGPGGKVGVGKL